MHHMFVYGTLKRGFPNHNLMREARFVGDVRSRVRYALIVAGRWFSPTLVEEPGAGHCVRGELYVIDDDGLAALDELEGTHLPLGYDRIGIDVVGVEGGETLTAWTYAKPRAQIGGIHSEPLEEYRPDPRYVPGKERGERGPGRVDLAG